ncbi:MAG: hypothetical protein JW902_06660 [Syntrophaceae bacterium]|nr:hypothetical protein [Syntrophaceae bacterium]
MNHERHERHEKKQNVNLKVDKRFEGAIMSIGVELIDVPEELVPSAWQVEYRLKLLCINGVAPALAGLSGLQRRDREFERAANMRSIYVN